MLGCSEQKLVWDHEHHKWGPPVDYLRTLVICNIKSNQTHWFRSIQNFWKFSSISRQLDLVNNLNGINGDKSLIVVLSHCWLRDHPVAEGWVGRSHPDMWMEKIPTTLCERVVICDFVCIDQDIRRAEHAQTDCGMHWLVVHSLTPDWNLVGAWAIDTTNTKLNWWNSEPFAYLNTGWWCRGDVSCSPRKRQSFFHEKDVANISALVKEIMWERRIRQSRNIVAVFRL